MQNASKLAFFNTFKNDYTPSSYLGLTNKLSERKEVVKFRIGNHKLTIETGECDYIARPFKIICLFVHLIKLKTNLAFLYIAINTLF